MPATLALPAVGRASPVRIRIVVVLPAPFGPRSPKTDPGRHVEVEAVEREDAPNRLDSPRAWIARPGQRHRDPGRSQGRGHASSRPTTR